MRNLTAKDLLKEVRAIKARLETNHEENARLVEQKLENLGFSIKPIKPWNREWRSWRIEQYGIKGEVYLHSTRLSYPPELKISWDGYKETYKKDKRNSFSDLVVSYEALTKKDINAFFFRFLRKKLGL